MTGCPHIEECPLFPFFRFQANLKTWKIRYCYGEFAQCARYALTEEGREVPAQLLPSGKMLPVLR